MPGRKPTSLHLLHGTYKPCRHDGKDPRPPDGDGSLEPPDYLSAREQEIWRESVASAPVNVLHRIDKAVLGTFVMHAALIETAARAQRDLDAGERYPLLTRRSDGSYGESAFVAILRRSGAALLRAASELGFTPVSRARLPIPAASRGPEPSPWDRFREVQARIAGERRRPGDDELERAVDAEIEGEDGEGGDGDDAA